MAILHKVIRRGLTQALSALLLGAMITCLGVQQAWGAEAQGKKVEPAKYSVSGYGWLGNRELKRMLKTMQPQKERPEFFGAAFVEDAALLLNARVKRDGYLNPEIMAHLQLENGERMQVNADELIEEPLPRPLRVKRVRFEIRKGRLYFFDSLTFEGLQTLSANQAKSYFVETDTLLRLKRNRKYTPERFKRGLSSLTSVLERQGYQEVKVETTSLDVNDATGAVQARIHVNQGPKYIVRSLREEISFDGSKPAETNVVFPAKPYSELWQQDLALRLKTNLYAMGFPDTRVATRILERDQEENRTYLDLLASVQSGEQVRVGEVEFRGQKHTSENFMAEQIPLETGELLNRIEAEQGRTKLATLGVFRSVELRYEPEDADTRNLIYSVEEAERLNLSLLFGWGSYELLRGGLIVEALNIWGRAHHARLRAIQSIKSSRGDLTYTIPTFLGRDLDTFVHGSGLRREEVDFTRLEYGGGVGFHKFFQDIGTDLTVRYNYEILNALNTIPAVESEGLIDPAVGSIIADLKFDRRDNPLYPRKGYKLFVTLETAAEQMGGDANYQRIELSPSWHQRLGGGRTLSVGLTHGVAISFGDPADNLPFNRRYFPGGDHSIRGYQEGEASPRNPEGKYIGAETFTLGVVEFEQALTPQWAVVAFVDSLGFARRLDDYPFDTELFSAGGGIRWKTLVGPVRLEYGHNLNPREGDPDWTIHFSLGFPF